MKKLIYSLLYIPLVVFSQSDFEKGESYFKTGKYEIAKEFFLKSYEKYPSDVKTIEYLGDIEGINKQWVKAQEYYLKLRNLYPTNANYHFKYGGALAMQVQKGSYLYAAYHINEMIANFEKAIDLNPNHIEARWALIEVYLRIPSLLGGSEEKALEYSDELLKISPVDGYLSKGHVAEYLKKHLQAETYFKKALEVSGGSKNAYKRLINLYELKMKQPEKAAPLKKELNKKHP